MTALDWSLGDLLKIVLTVLCTAGASTYAARRAVAHELTKQRNARGFDRRAQWYETARGELRQLSEFADALLDLQFSLELQSAAPPVTFPRLVQQFAEAEARVHELILGAAVYATPETVERLNTLGRALDEVGSVVDPAGHRSSMGNLLEDGIGPPEDAEARAQRVRIALIRAFAHVLDETRALHGFDPLPVENSPMPDALVNATLRAPRRLSPADERP